MRNPIIAPLVLLPMAVSSLSVQATEFMTVSQAQTLLFPSAPKFIARDLTLDDTQRERIKAATGVRQRNAQQQVWRAERDGQLLGWFMLDEVIGKHEFISYAVAISPQGKVIGMEVLSYRETHGGQVREPAWRKNFQGKTLADPFKLDEDVPNISGATLSCRNLLDGVKRLLTLHKFYLSNA